MIDGKKRDWQKQIDENSGKTAKTIDQASQLIENGFGYICEIDGIKLFRKRK
jgi:hypothetical protein